MPVAAEAKLAKPGTRAAGKPVATASSLPWSNLSSAAVANNPSPELGGGAPSRSPIPLPLPRPRPKAEKPQAKLSPEKPQAR
jgi:hypothetical protein